MKVTRIDNMKIRRVDGLVHRVRARVDANYVSDPTLTYLLYCGKRVKHDKYTSNKLVEESVVITCILCALEE